MLYFTNVNTNVKYKYLKITNVRRNVNYKVKKWKKYIKNNILIIYYLLW